MAKGPWKNKNPFDVYLRTIYNRQRLDANPSHRNIDWSLTFDEWKEHSTSNCYYCGDVPVLKEGKSHLNKGERVPLNGIDRINNDEGYHNDNCRPCCSVCNYMKRQTNEQDFIEQVEKIWRNKCQLIP